ncbi:MAG: hypothetical protein KAH38_05355, partial [Candidatus Hydrogenedentes bacterium]|nr:hypothetical protein [Candidatus Hydrogenedentota bacterium]
RAAALDGIRAFPVAEAYDVVLELLENNDLENLPINLMVGVAVNALAAGREEEGRKLMREIMPRLTTTDAVRRAIDAMRTQKPNPEFARALGYITQWYLAGPFHWNKGDAFEGVFIGEPQISLTDSYSEDEKTLAWQLHTSSDTSALFNLMGLLGPIDSAVAFAYIEIEAAEDGPAQIRVGSDDGIRAWVNNEEVLQINIDRGYAIDQNISDITLKQGKNVILMQITQIAGGWAFAARLTYPDGTPLEFTIVEQ